MDEIETSFMDLPDEIHINIMKKLDLPSCLKLRVNRRLDRLQLDVKNECTVIVVNIYATHYKLVVTHSNARSSFESRDFKSLEKGLLRLALNTRVDHIFMRLLAMPNKVHCRIADALLTFEANRCIFATNNLDGLIFLNLHDCAATVGAPLCNLRQIAPSNFHTIAKNFADFYSSNIGCNSLTAQDFVIIRKAMLEDDCKLKSFEMKVEKAMEKSFMEACFGVAFEDFAGPLRGRIFRATDESVELYSYRPPLSADRNSMSHMEGNLQTTITVHGSKYCIIFENNQEQKAKWAAMKSDTHKIQLNHVYMMQ